MPTSSTPIYFDWQFWSAVVAVLAVVLSQVPPIRLWFRPRRLEVEVHSRLLINHKVGNPNVSMFMSVRNTGGRELRIKSLKLALIRDGLHLSHLPAQNYFENPSSTSTVLFVPFSLKPSETWAHGVNFLNFFDRTSEKLYRERESALSMDIRNKIKLRPKNDKDPVLADPSMVKPFTDMFEKLFLWHPGEYVIELSVETEPGAASFTRKYRFTLYESDSAELRSHTDDYQIGGGLSFNVDRHIGVLVPLQQHS